MFGILANVVVGVVAAAARTNRRRRSRKRRRRKTTLTATVTKAVERMVGNCLITTGIVVVAVMVGVGVVVVASGEEEVIEPTMVEGEGKVTAITAAATTTPVEYCLIFLRVFLEM
jgi:hypothetical protein